MKKIKLRPYQQSTLDSIYTWFEKNPTGNPCVVLPTGAGKSLIVAEFIRHAMKEWPSTRILMCVHTKELIQQNAEKLLALWPNCNLGIYSASIGEKTLGKPVTFAGIQSIHRKAEEVGYIDICLIDECHLISHKQEGTYRSFLNDLMAINPNMRVVGLTATPYRASHGSIAEGEDRLFHDLIEPTSIEELINLGFLAPLKSKHTIQQIDTSGIKKVGGDYALGDLEIAANAATEGIVEETLRRAASCKSILVFAVGVKHAEDLALEFRKHGVEAEYLTGSTSKHEREDIIRDFKNGSLRVLTNCAVLTTGFDHPDTDCVVLARPTLSANLYSQMAGRGLRLKSHTDHCLVLDFGGLVARHGPITNVIPPKKAGKGSGEAPIKTCPGLEGACLEIVHASVMTCPECGYVFPPLEKDPIRLHADDIMGILPLDMNVASWTWEKHVGKSSGKDMLRVKYYPMMLTDPIVAEFLCVEHDGYAGDKARGLLAKLANKSDAMSLPDNIKDMAAVMNLSKHPTAIKYKRDGKFFKIISREWI
jgi:DNA repair protein RadD